MHFYAITRWSTHTRSLYFFHKSWKSPWWRGKYRPLPFTWWNVISADGWRQRHHRTFDVPRFPCNRGFNLGMRYWEKHNKAKRLQQYYNNRYLECMDYLFLEFSAWYFQIRWTQAIEAREVRGRKGSQSPCGKTVYSDIVANKIK